MKRTKLLAMVSVTLGAFCASAQAEVVAGWDFSPYMGDGSLVAEMGGMPQDTLSANYSTFDPTDGAGAEAAAFGTLYFDGSSFPMGISSTNVDETAMSPIFAPTTAVGGSLMSNLDAPTSCCVPFDSFMVLQNEGQDFANSLAMTATDAVDIVFEVDLSTVAQEASEFELSFAGRTLSGNANVAITFASDTGGGAGMAMLDDQDSLFTTPLSTGVSETVRVMFSIPAPSAEVGQVIIDNVAITATVPEPGQAGFLAASLSVVALGAFRARRPRAA